MSLLKFILPEKSDIIDTSKDRSREYAQWLKDNIKELNLDLKGFMDKFGLKKVVAEGVLKGKLVKHKEDKKFLHFFKVGNTKSSDIIRNNRNECFGQSEYSRCSNATLASYTGINIERLNEITQGKSEPKAMEINILSIALGISDKDTEKLYKQLQKSEEKLNKKTPKSKEATHSEDKNNKHQPSSIISDAIRKKGTHIKSRQEIQDTEKKQLAGDKKEFRSLMLAVFGREEIPVKDHDKIQVIEETLSKEDVRSFIKKIVNPQATTTKENTDREL